MLQKTAFSIATLFSLAACDATVSDNSTAEPSAPSVAPTDPDLYFVRGYPNDGDACQLIGETAYTVNFLDDAADLVACMTGSSEASNIGSLPNSQVAAQKGSYTLYSVGRR